MNISVNNSVESDILFASKQSLQEYALPPQSTIRARDFAFSCSFSLMQLSPYLRVWNYTAWKLLEGGCASLEEDQSPSNNPVAKSCLMRTRINRDFLRNESTISMMTRDDHAPINFIGVTQRQI